MRTDWQDKKECIGEEESKKATEPQTKDILVPAPINVGSQTEGTKGEEGVRIRAHAAKLVVSGTREAKRHG